jgi:hypothetical protein
VLTCYQLAASPCIQFERQQRLHAAVRVWCHADRPAPATPCPPRPARSTRDMAGFCCGLASICCWLVAQVPQLVRNYRTQSAEALSPWFLAEWLLVGGGGGGRGGRGAEGGRERLR